MDTKRYSIVVYIVCVFILLCICILFVNQRSPRRTHSNEHFTAYESDTDNIDNYLLSRPILDVHTPYMWQQPARLQSLYLNDLQSIRFTGSPKNLDDLVLTTQAAALDKCVASPLYAAERTDVEKESANVTANIASASTEITQYNEYASQMKANTTDLETNIRPVMKELSYVRDCVFTVDNILTGFYVYTKDTKILGIEDISGDANSWYSAKKVKQPFILDGNTVVSFATVDTNNDTLHQNTAGLILASDLDVFSTHKDNWIYWEVYARNSSVDNPPNDKYGNQWYEVEYNRDGDVPGWSSPVKSFSAFYLYSLTHLTTIPPYYEQADYKMWASSGNDSSTRTGNKNVWFRFKYITSH